MPFMDYEFPNSNFYDNDLRELVRLYKELVATYDSLQKEIQDTIDFVNNFEEHADELIDERISVVMSLYTQRLLAVEAMVKALEEEINKDDGLTGQIQEVREGLATLKTQVFNLEMHVDDKFNDVIELMHAYKNSMDKYVDSKAEMLEQYIKDTVTKLDRLDVINPLTGQFEDIQKVLDQMVTVIVRSYGLTAKQYDDLELTARNYDRLLITAYEYSTRGYFELTLKLKQNLMRSPFTGGMARYDDIIYQLANLHKCALTAAEYDSRELTAGEFDRMQITAYMYDWMGFKVARLITAELYDALKLTAQQYDDKMVTAEQYDKGMRYLVGGEISGNCTECSDITILANQIANLTNLVVEYKKEVENFPKVITTASGISYVGELQAGDTVSRVKAPELLEDSVVGVISEKTGVLPVAIKRYGTTVETEWTVQDTDMLYTVSVQNRKED